MLGACGFHAGGTAPDGSAAPDAPVIDDAGNVLETWTYPDDHLFTEPMSAFSEMGVETWKTLTPAGYIPGGLVVHASVGNLWMATQTDAQITWDPTTTATLAGTGVARVLYLPPMTVGLPALGIAHADHPFSLWLEGELLLTPGNHVLGALADGVAFIDMASPGDSDFARVTTARSGMVVEGTFAATASDAAWYPIRIGYANAPGPNATLTIYQHDTAAALPDRVHLRGRGEGMRGLLRDVFDEQVLATQTEQIGLHGSNFADEGPNYLPPGANGEYSVHFSGEYYAHAAGAYALHAASDDANRLFFGDAVDDSGWVRNAAGNSVGDVTPSAFDVGWQPIAVDYNQQNGMAKLAVSLTSAPTGVNTGILDVGDIRPVEPPAERVITAYDGTHYPVIDNNPALPATASLPVVGAADEVATRADISVNGDLHWDDIHITLERPDGAMLEVRPGGTDHLMGQQIVYVPVTDATFLGGGAMNGTWKVLVDDAVAGGGGANMVTQVFLTLHAKGGWDSVAKLATWRSPIVDLGTDLVSVDQVSWMARLPANAEAHVALRACDMSDCTGTDFQDVDNGAGAPQITSGRYLQLQVTLTSDGQREPELEQLQLQFRRKGQ